MSGDLTKRGQELRTARLAMEYARLHDCTLIEAKAMMAAQRRRDAEALLARLRSCGTDARTAAAPTPLNHTKNDAACADQPWMMRD